MITLKQRAFPNKMMNEVKKYYMSFHVREFPGIELDGIDY
jgi:hypothetical protein